ncbi:MAG: CPBP family intramembrane metalloprotease [Bacteroidota bacterium]|nr:CPBP family intramembrane metalloprotease [Bacteroidota bacterium]
MKNSIIGNLYLYANKISIFYELIIILFVSFGYLILNNVLFVLNIVKEFTISNDHIYFQIRYEIFVLLTLGIFLYLRGWNFKSLGLKPCQHDIFIGLLIYLCFCVLTIFIWSIGILVSPGFGASKYILFQVNLNIYLVILISILNPFFEEILVCSYILSWNRGATNKYAMIFLSVCIRILYHLYQGPFILVQIIPFGIIAGVWFTRTRRLWPLLIAHFLWDIIGLLPHTGK